MFKFNFWFVREKAGLERSCHQVRARILKQTSASEVMSLLEIVEVDSSHFGLWLNYWEKEFRKFQGKERMTVLSQSRPK